jgi:hypothetical protein
MSFRHRRSIYGLEACAVHEGNSHLAASQVISTQASGPLPPKREQIAQ